MARPLLASTSLAAALLQWAALPALAFPENIELIPNGDNAELAQLAPFAGVEQNCIICHVGPDGGEVQSDLPRNPFGQDIEATYQAPLVPDWQAVWFLDSDNDGFTNGEELGDPCGLFARSTCASFAADPGCPGDSACEPFATAAGSDACTALPLAPPAQRALDLSYPGQAASRPVGRGGDDDDDDVCDADDNCDDVANADQTDGDGDGVGDACEPVAGEGEGEGEGEGDGAPPVGDGPDGDGDGVPDDTDVCPGVRDVPQEDTDGDGVGDRCDNCLVTLNADQADADGDGRGDACSTAPPLAVPRGRVCGAAGGAAEIAPLAAILWILGSARRAMRRRAGSRTGRH